MLVPRLFEEVLSLLPSAWTQFGTKRQVLRSVTEASRTSVSIPAPAASPHGESARASPRSVHAVVARRSEHGAVPADFDFCPQIAAVKPGQVRTRRHALNNLNAVVGQLVQFVRVVRNEPDLPDAHCLQHGRAAPIVTSVVGK